MGLYEALIKDPEFLKEFAGMIHPDGGITIDQSRSQSVWSDVCSHCQRLRDCAERRCDAFGDQVIPDEIWNGKNDHSGTVPGDGGLLFVQMKQSD